MAQAIPVEEAAGNRLVFEDSVEVKAPISEVYNRWTELRRFPDFMSNVQEVRPVDGNRYHWVARIFGTKQEWDAEVTEHEAPRRIAWRSTTGPYNAGVVRLSELPSGNTEVRLRLEYVPPAGKTGQMLDKATQTTRREVREDLHNFKRLLSEETEVAREATQPPGFGRVIGSLAAPIATGIAGGTAAYFLERNLRKSAAARRVSAPVMLPAAIASWTMAGATIASIATAASLRARGRRHDALFVGQWAPTLLEMGILSRLAGHRGMHTDLPTVTASWGLTAASAGSMIASIVLHARGMRRDGLFVGQWAPTFIGGALMARLIGR